MSERLFLETHVGVQVDLCGLRRFVAEPQSDHAEVHTVAQEIHGCGMSKRVGRDGLADEGATGSLGLSDVPGDEALQCVGTEGTTAGGGKCGGTWIQRLFGEPCLEDFNNVRTEWRAARLPALAPATDVRTGAEYHVFGV